MIFEKIMKYFSLTEKDENARYKSWVHCHRYFLENKENLSATDSLCLHLAFYLASWGMLRGRSFLLQKDYLVHEPVVNILLEHCYGSLWNCSAENMKQPITQQLIIECQKRIIQAYKDKTQYVDGRYAGGIIASDTLITKILLGTFGCTPAYDRYFCAGMQSIGLHPVQFSAKSVSALSEFYINNPEFTKAEEEIKQKGFAYPPAKILDMFFWQVGFDIDADEGLRVYQPIMEKPDASLNADPDPVETSISAASRVRTYIRETIQKTGQQGQPYVDLIARDIGKTLEIKKSFPTICDAMRKVMEPRDTVISDTPSGKSSTITIRYFT